MRDIVVEDQNAIREESKFVNKKSGEAHVNHMCRLMKYVVENSECGFYGA